MDKQAQVMQVCRDGVTSEASISYWLDGGQSWSVRLESSAFAPVEATEDDAFEALCSVRSLVEPQGWRIGVAGARSDVWPSGMARDQGGGRRVYHLTEGGPQGLLDTFEPVDPATVVTVEQQRAETERLFAAMRDAAQA